MTTTKTIPNFTMRALANLDETNLDWQVDLGEVPESPTAEPVTASGWYPRVDGTVGFYAWVNGHARCTRAVASWADVPSREPETAEETKFRMRQEGKS